MKRSDRLKTLTRLTESAERLARIQLAKATQEVQRKRAQQVQLEEYLGEYRRNLIASGEQGISGHALSRHRVFLDGLERTIETQVSAVAKAQHALQQSMAIWHAQRQRHQVFDGLVDAAKAEENREVLRKEQKALDESGSRSRGDVYHPL